jgi:Flp pilus assembly protein TadD
VLGSGRTQEAIDLIGRAIQIRPDEAEAHNNLGSALRAAGRLDEAAKSYFRAAQLKPTLASARNNLGVVLAAQYQYEPAIDSYHRSIAIQPDLVQAHHNLGNALGAIGKFDEAAESFRKVIALKPDNADAHLNLAMTLLMKGDSLHRRRSRNSPNRNGPASLSMEKRFSSIPSRASAMHCSSSDSFPCSPSAGRGSFCGVRKIFRGCSRRLPG